ncbi:MAG: Uma2 family endonuclease [Candidatus Eremiobacteraeota bacterium]|nr:Uma2 family endonuclease [Candidatus Eremiobacteraeota bacterium]
MADSAEVRRALLTYEDYLCLPSDGKRYEVLEGGLIMNPAPDLSHQGVSRNLVVILSNFLKGTNTGALYHAPVDVVLDDRTIVQPDIIFISKEKSSILGSRGIEGAPDLVVEIHSASTMRTDRVIKFQLYAQFGVEWYWMLDPRVKVLEEYARKGEGYTLVSEHSGNTIFKPALFPGLAIELGEVWE